MKRQALFLLMPFLGLGACKPGANEAAVLISPRGELGNGLQRLWQKPDFELIDQNAKAFSSKQMDGRIWVVDFFYTTCPGPCPALTSRLSDVHKKFSHDERVGFLSISSNPEKDQPDVLKAYADRFGADRRWFFLTGPKEAIFAVANQGFKLSLTENAEGAEPVTHSTRLMLVDSQGWVRGSYEAVGEDGTAAGARLVTDIQTLLNESK